MVKDISRRTADAGTWASPTLSVFRQIISQAAHIDAVIQRPEMSFFPRHLTTGASVSAPNFGWYPPDNPYVKRWPPERIPYLRAQYSAMECPGSGLARCCRDWRVPTLSSLVSFQDSRWRANLDNFMKPVLRPSKSSGRPRLTARVFLGRPPTRVQLLPARLRTWCRSMRILWMTSRMCFDRTA